jgi:hypothetical protein
LNSTKSNSGSIINLHTPPQSGLAKGSGRIGYLLTAHNHNPAIECIRDCYFPIRNVVVPATPPILAVFPAVSAFCASAFPLWPLDGTSKRIGQDSHLLCRDFTPSLGCPC